MEIDIAYLVNNLDIVMSHVANGEKVIVLKEGTPFAEISKIKKKRKQKRPIGLCKGMFEVTDDFFEPLPKEIMEGFGK